MKTTLEYLTDEEKVLVYNAPVLITLLIAGADDKVDYAEIHEAMSTRKILKQKVSQEIVDYYKEVFQDFEDKIKIGIYRFPSDRNRRQKEIEEKLIELNRIFQKIEKPFVQELYKSLKDLARRIAQASGGILGFNSIGREEAHLIDLKIITDPNLLCAN